MSGPALHLLDEPHLRSHAGHAALPSNVPGFLVAYLASHGDWQSREAVTAAFWPDRSASEGLHNLRVNLHRARQWLASLGLGERLEGERRRVRLALDCDVPAFLSAIDSPDAAAALGAYHSPAAQSSPISSGPLVSLVSSTPSSGIVRLPSSSKPRPAFTSPASTRPAQPGSGISGV